VPGALDVFIQPRFARLPATVTRLRAQRNVVRNSIDPGARARVAAKRRQSAPDSEENVLKQVVSIGGAEGVRSTNGERNP
jgi:hypothetical protein